MNKKILIIFILILMLSVRKVDALEGTVDVKLSNCVDSTSARFILNNEELKVKFIGIEVGEFMITDEYDETNGKPVEEYVCSLLKEAKSIKLEYEPKIEEKDKYGRVSAWVFVDDNLLQEHLVSIGVAKVAYLYDDYTYNDFLQESEKTAKDNKIGIWREKQEEPKKEEKKEEPKKKGFFDGIIDFFNGIFKSIVDFFNDIVEDVNE